MAEINDMSIQEIAEELAGRQATEMAAVKAEIEGLAESVGLSVKYSEVKPAAKKSQVKPKYRNPDDETETWSGRGQLPVWMRERVEAGADKEEFLIAD